MTDSSQMHAQPPEDHVFERYLAGDCSPAERASVERWIADHRADAAAVDAVRATTAQYLRAWPTPDSAAAVARLFARLGLSDTQGAASVATSGLSASRRRQPVRHASSWTVPLRWATPMVAGIAAVLAVLFVGSRQTTRPTSFERSYATHIGQRANIILDDGTRVTLAPASTLQIVSGFGHATREVALVGEGYFDVSHTTGAPFTVRTGGVVTRVLGTGFDVSRYPGDRETRVAVTRGKVELHADHRDAVALTAGVVGFATDSTIVRTEHDDTTHYTAWRDGRLIFRDTPAPEAIATIGRWYGVDVRLPDSVLQQKRLNGTIAYQSVANAMLELEVLLDATATYESTPGAHPIVTFHACPADCRARRTRPNSFTTPTEVGR